jgi:pseudouridine-5'-phosphate glycosidase
LTLEYLETRGIPVVTFGQDEFPSFYSRKSGYKSPLRLDTTEEMELHIQQALHAAKENKINGKEVTPFLLKYIAEHTNGESLGANIALIKHNAKVVAEIAVAYSSLK